MFKFPIPTVISLGKTIFDRNSHKAKLPQDISLSLLLHGSKFCITLEKLLKSV